VIDSVFSRSFGGVKESRETWKEREAANVAGFWEMLETANLLLLFISVGSSFLFFFFFFFFIRCVYIRLPSVEDVEVNAIGERKRDRQFLALCQTFPLFISSLTDDEQKENDDERAGGPLLIPVSSSCPPVRLVERH